MDITLRNSTCRPHTATYHKFKTTGAETILYIKFYVQTAFVNKILLDSSTTSALNTQLCNNQHSIAIFHSLTIKKLKYLINKNNIF